jgi:hypothetical protein
MRLPAYSELTLTGATSSDGMIGAQANISVCAAQAQEENLVRTPAILGTGSPISSSRDPPLCFSEAFWVLVVVSGMSTRPGGARGRRWRISMESTGAFQPVRGRDLEGRCLASSEALSVTMKAPAALQTRSPSGA